jgi:hypothetical protein
MQSVMVMFLVRMGSLNALEQSKESLFWKKWLDASLPSADSVGRIVDLIDPEDIRRTNHHIYGRLKRNKAINSPWQGLIPLILDGHESHASYRRHCPGCLKRTIKTRQGERVQYYHRHVTAQLAGRPFHLLLDAEFQRPGEDEVAAALRLLKRLIENYPRAFDLVLGDALYTDPRFYNFLLSRKKDVLTVLKDENRDLVQDARRLFEEVTPAISQEGATKRECWDLEGFTSWFQVGKPVRVVGSQETSFIRRQRDNQLEEKVSHWLWVTTLSCSQATTNTIVQLGHERWAIENQGFNESVTRWHANHVYKHSAAAMLNFWLILMIAQNIFLAFYHRNLKPIFRKRVSMLHLSRLLASSIYQEIQTSGWHPP